MGVGVAVTVRFIFIISMFFYCSLSVSLKEEFDLYTCLHTCVCPRLSHRACMCVCVCVCAYAGVCLCRF